MWTGPDCSSNLYSKPDLSSFNAKHGFFNGWKADLFLLTPFFFLLRSDPGENKSGNWATLVSENEMNQTSRMNKLLIMLKWLTWVDLHFLGQIDIQRFNEFFRNLFYSTQFVRSCSHRFRSKSKREQHSPQCASPVLPGAATQLSFRLKLIGPATAFYSVMSPI